MATRNIQKSLIGMEDFQQGVGQVSQTRAGAPYGIGKVDIPYPVQAIAEMSALDVERFTRARVYSSVTTYVDYIYNAADLTGIPSDNGSGTWVVSQTIASVVTLRTLEPTSANQLVYILGHTDGFPFIGDGCFRYDESDNTSPDDNGLTIVTSDGARWKRVTQIATPEMFGALTTSDDSAAVTAAFQSAIEATGTSAVYTLENSVALTDVNVANLKVRVSGAHKPYAISVTLTMPTDFKAFNISIAGNSLVNVGLYCEGLATADTTASFDTLVITDVLRKVAFDNGDGLFWQGFADVVNVHNVVVRRVLLDAGAGVPGVVGVTGITVKNSAEDPKVVNITDSVIDTVTTLDLSYHADQDGVRVLSTLSTGSSFTDQTVSITGCKFTNCLGRSIKSQATNTLVQGCTFTHNTFWDNNSGQTTIDFQFAGGKIDSCIAVITGGVPGSNVVISSYRFANEIVTTDISNFKVKNDVRISRFFASGISGAGPTITNMGASLTNVHVDLVDYLLNVDNTEDTNLTTLELTNCSADCASAAVRLSNDVNAMIHATGVRNLAATVPTVNAFNNSAFLLTAKGCINLDETEQLYAPSIINDEGGFIQHRNVTIDNATITVLPIIGNLNRALHFFRSSGDRNEVAIGCADNASIVPVFAGVDVTFNLPTNPGTINIYIAAGVINIENLSGSNRDMNVVSFMTSGG